MIIIVKNMKIMIISIKNNDNKYLLLKKYKINPNEYEMNNIKI